jgi:prolyl-tRNA editing enzyme YbaK/EbsC (Cys-tRNA(Pro) deacylase)
MASDDERVGKVRSMVEKHGLDAEIVWHREDPVLSLEDAMRVHGLSPGNVLKCLLMKSRKGKVIAVIAPGDVRIDVKRLGELAGVKKLSFVSGEELRERFSVEPGGLDPLTLPGMADLVFVERSLLDWDWVMGSAGSRYCGLRVKPGELVEALGVPVVDVAKP